MSKLKLLDAKQLEKLLFMLGFEISRQKGSHVSYRHPDGRFTVIPHHPGQMISRPLLRAIIREIEISVDQYNELAQKV